MPVCLFAETEDVTGDQLTMWEMEGVFAMLVAGIVVGFLCLLLEYVMAAHRDTVQDRRKGVSKNTS